MMNPGVLRHLSAVGLLFLGFGLYFTLAEISLSLRGTVATATVQDHRLGGPSLVRGQWFYPVLRVQGRTGTFVCVAQGGSGSSLEPGQGQAVSVIYVIYQTDERPQCEIDTFAWRWRNPLFMSVFGLFLAVFRNRPVVQEIAKR
jgi:hypothetical protein